MARGRPWEYLNDYRQQAAAGPRRFQPKQHTGPSEESQAVGGVMQGVGGLLTLIPGVGPAIGGTVMGIGAAIPAVDSAVSGGGAAAAGEAMGRFGGAAGALSRDPRLAPAPQARQMQPIPQTQIQTPPMLQPQPQTQFNSYPQQAQQAQQASPMQPPGGQQLGSMRLQHRPLLGRPQEELRSQAAIKDNNRAWWG